MSTVGTLVYWLKGFASDKIGASFDPSGIGKVFESWDAAFEYAKEYARCVAGRDGDWWTEQNGDDRIVLARKVDGYNECIRVVTDRLVGPPERATTMNRQSRLRLSS